MISLLNVILKWLHKITKCDLYLSLQIQNKIISCIGDNIRQNILSDVSKSPFFSILGNETTDASTTEQLTICVRYLKGLEIREDFFGFASLTKTNSETIYNDLIENLIS